MKKIFTLLSLTLLSATSFGQITINAIDIPTPSGSFNLDEITSTNPPTPGAFANQSWNYGTYFGNIPLTNNYQTETNSFFTSAGIDVNNIYSKGFNASLFYNVIGELDFSSTGVTEAGIHVPVQGYDLSSFTTSILDSLKIPDQQYILTAPKKIMQFPMTLSTTWQSTSQRATNFTLSVAAYALSNAPAEHRYSVTRKDSIAGWGKLSVYTPAGPSASYDVLVDKGYQFAIDSFFLNGSPAPTPLLSAFGVTQGQQTDKQYYYNFHRKGSFNYLMRFYYGSDNTYSTMEASFVHKDNLVVTGLSEVSGNSYLTLIYPNPVIGNDLHVEIFGQTIASARYSLTDISGKMVQQGDVSMDRSSVMKVTLAETLSNGYYILQINDGQRSLLSEQISVQRQ